MSITKLAIFKDSLLTPNNNKIPEETKESLSAAGELGVHLAILTDSNMLSLSRTVKDLDSIANIFDFYILYNGAMIFDVKNNKILKDFPIMHHRVQEIESFARSKNLNFYCITDKCLISDANSDFTKNASTNMQIPAEITDPVKIKGDEKIYRIIISGSEPRINEAFIILEKEYYNYCCVSKLDSTHIEILSVKADKEEIYTYIKGLLDIKYDEVSVFIKEAEKTPDLINKKIVIPMTEEIKRRKEEERQELNQPPKPSQLISKAYLYYPNNFFVAFFLSFFTFIFFSATNNDFIYYKHAKFIIWFFCSANISAWFPVLYKARKTTIAGKINEENKEKAAFVQKLTLCICWIPLILSFIWNSIKNDILSGPADQLITAFFLLVFIVCPVLHTVITIPASKKR